MKMKQPAGMTHFSSLAVGASFVWCIQVGKILFYTFKCAYENKKRHSKSAYFHCVTFLLICSKQRKSVYINKEYKTLNQFSLSLNSCKNTL